MTKECALIDGVIYCQCGEPYSHYGTMGERGAREVRCEAPPQRSSNQWLGALKARFATGTIIWKRSHTESLFNEIERLHRELEHMADMQLSAAVNRPAHEPPAVTGEAIDAARAALNVDTNVTYPSHVAARQVRHVIRELIAAYEQLHTIYTATCAAYCREHERASSPPVVNHDESVLMLQDFEDAKRYRWIRDNQTDAVLLIVDWDLDGADADELDSAIDSRLGITKEPSL